MARTAAVALALCALLSAQVCLTAYYSGSPIGTTNQADAKVSLEEKDGTNAMYNIH